MLTSSWLRRRVSNRMCDARDYVHVFGRHCATAAVQPSGVKPQFSGRRSLICAAAPAPYLFARVVVVVFEQWRKRSYKLAFLARARNGPILRRRPTSGCEDANVDTDADRRADAVADATTKRNGRRRLRMSTREPPAGPICHLNRQRRSRCDHAYGCVRTQR